MKLISGYLFSHSSSVCDLYSVVFVRMCVFSTGGVVLYRSHPSPVLRKEEASSESEPTPPGDASPSAIRTRTHFPETWLWDSLLVNGYLVLISTVCRLVFLLQSLSLLSILVTAGAITGLNRLYISPRRTCFLQTNAKPAAFV